MRNGRRWDRTPRSPTSRRRSRRADQLTDPDSRVVKGPRGLIQGYNAQAVTTEDQIVVAAEVMVASPDFGHLEPMLDAARSELDAAGVSDARRWWSPTPATGTTNR